MRNSALTTAVIVLIVVFTLGTLSSGALACSACEVQDLVGTAVQQQGFYRLVEAIVAADLTEELAAEGPFTLFAPSDEAFAALPAGLWTELLEDPEALAELLRRHVLPGRYSAADLMEWAGHDMQTLSGQTLHITVDSVEVFVNGSTMTATNILASNGFIHQIDAVLLPAE